MGYSTYIFITGIPITKNLFFTIKTCLQSDIHASGLYPLNSKNHKKNFCVGVCIHLHVHDMLHIWKSIIYVRGFSILLRICLPPIALDPNIQKKSFQTLEFANFCTTKMIATDISHLSEIYKKVLSFFSCKKH